MACLNGLKHEFRFKVQLPGKLTTQARESGLSLLQVTHCRSETQPDPRKFFDYLTELCLLKKLFKLKPTMAQDHYTRLSSSNKCHIF